MNDHGREPSVSPAQRARGQRSQPLLLSVLAVALGGVWLTFPNGVLGPLDSGHRYAWAELHGSERDMYLAVDIDAVTPVLDLRVIFNAPDVWASPGQ